MRCGASVRRAGAFRSVGARCFPRVHAVLVQRQDVAGALETLGSFLQN